MAEKLVEVLPGRWCLLSNVAAVCFNREELIGSMRCGPNVVIRLRDCSTLSERVASNSVGQEMVVSLAARINAGREENEAKKEEGK